jgi:hypothetical protein
VLIIVGATEGIFFQHQKDGCGPGSCLPRSSFSLCFPGKPWKNWIPKQGYRIVGMTLAEHTVIKKVKLI